VGGPALVHVDAYRLGSVVEVDDLDLDAALEDSVTVVEWGEGKVDDLAEDRLLVSVVRPRGDAVPPVPAAVPDDDASDEDDGTAEPRTVTFAGVGERWSGVDLDALLGAVAR
jgi:tRNA threonylcarbamoyladenosine biosynthesis protein TsaE